jgi:Multiubiquitin
METAEKVKVIIVTVNNKPVEFKVHSATGAEIKATAIAQGVRIQQDFLLFEIRDHEPLKPVRDDEVESLHDGLKFRATAPDDNS